ncbi:MULTISPECIES: metallothiol transferase FosB [Staphylococcus]|uniref:Metallothiol transferase FosB n=2 Tax=Staphylococcus agnetis TaxID=985762 RepID=A0AAW9YR61_9STAP|nr:MULTISPECIES: metallothiol transferase FosB [Staphylococcus]NHM92312.1 metallothiol transferase FosB [Staphylococcus sp. 10602379]NJI01637.1 metallothiol transferase FosB [Staphylococcus agnetis]NJI13223.1 metallothiol transferase FosB [Staphylococcus agnetis]PTH16346.1 metallothiol transferase FosB [Staphylococcus agnetis]PTH63606.1 metallothiol transferase FosB [Staphylococcus agnetis]
MIQGINHITYSVSDIKRSKQFYKEVLKDKIVMENETIVFFTLGNVWFALNEEKDIPRHDMQIGYTHLALSISEKDFEDWYYWLKVNKVNILKGRNRDIKEKNSIYFTDPDGYLLELYTGTLMDRINYYNHLDNDTKCFE